MSWNTKSVWDGTSQQEIDSWIEPPSMTVEQAKEEARKCGYEPVKDARTCMCGADPYWNIYHYIADKHSAKCFVFRKINILQSIKQSVINTFMTH